MTHSHGLHTNHPSVDFLFPLPPQRLFSILILFLLILRLSSVHPPPSPFYHPRHSRSAILTSSSSSMHYIIVNLLFSIISLVSSIPSTLFCHSIAHTPCLISSYGNFVCFTSFSVHRLNGSTDCHLR